MAEATATTAPGAATAATDTTSVKAARKAKELELPNRIHTWPYLVRMEFLAAILVMAFMTMWSITIDAPTEEAANPNKTPNPSKAPWYFLGLQEMLVYFDPWVAGVVLPSLIIVGLMVIPYIDVNPRGNGYYTWKERKFAISVFLTGFLGLWVAMIVIGTFFRGPGWNLFWPWQYWDPHKTVALTNVNFPYQIATIFNSNFLRDDHVQFVVGMIAVLGWYPGLAILAQALFRKKEIYKQLGAVRFQIVVFLFLIMAALPVKMILRHAFNTKYIWVTPWFNI